MASKQDYQETLGAAEDIADEESYNEEEDEDFDPSKEVEKRVDEDDDEDDEDNEDNEYNEKRPDYSHIESGQGGLVRTRRGRILEEQQMRENKYEELRETGISQQTISAWDELQTQSNQRLRKSISVMSEEAANESQNGLQEELVLIDRRYEFAGEILHEKKMIPKNSAEAQEYFNNLRFKKTQTGPDSAAASSTTKVAINDRGLKLRRVLKRPPILEQIIAGALKPKLTTLEKSRLDWATYVDKEGINDELSLHNKDGYLEKQDFLNRVESFKDARYQQMRKTELQQRLAGT